MIVDVIMTKKNDLNEYLSGLKVVNAENIYKLKQTEVFKMCFETICCTCNFGDSDSNNIFPEVYIFRIYAKNCTNFVLFSASWIQA